MAAGLDLSLAGHEAAISQDLPFGHPSLLRTDLPVPDKWCQWMCGQTALL